MRLHTTAFLGLALIGVLAACDEKKKYSEPRPTPAAPAAQPGGGGEQQLSDTDITNAVKQELRAERAIPKHEIDVSTELGVVQLTGNVTNLLAKERSERLASVIKGVRAVSNRITVQAKERPDEEIQKDIEKALLFDPAAESFEIDVEVKDQAATLKGKVESWQEKLVAERVAKGVKGVESVENLIQVQYKGERSDHDITADVRKKLRWDALIDDALINVAVADDVVTLSGTVGSLAEKNRAWADAWVAGVERVDNAGLEVKWWAKDEDLRGSKYVIKSDGEIQRAVEDALLVDPRVSSFDVTAKVQNRKVTLTGTVSSLKAKSAAEALAQNTTGVFGVDNRIEVQAPKPTDARTLQRRIEDTLLLNPITESYEIDVAVKDGAVTLKGDVDSFAEKAEAEDVVGTFAGVSGIENDLTVKNPVAIVYQMYAYPYYPHVVSWAPFRPAKPLKSDSEIRDDIGDELFWSPFVDREEVQLEVKNGVATLTGTVDSWHERRSAVENAFEGGAVAVKDNLKVE